MTYWDNPHAQSIIQDRAVERGWTLTHIGGTCFELSKRLPRARSTAAINVEFWHGGNLREANSDTGYSPTVAKLDWVLKQLDRYRS